jgi:hypothetical protein
VHFLLEHKLYYSDSPTKELTQTDIHIARIRSIQRTISLFPGFRNFKFKDDAICEFNSDDDRTEINTGKLFQNLLVLNVIYNRKVFIV